MAKYVLAYRGGGMPETEAEQQAELAAWGAWYGGIGEAVIDHGNPFGPSAAVAADGSTNAGAASGLSGYSILTAENLDAATEIAKACPILTSGGAVDVYETFNMG